MDLIEHARKLRHAAAVAECEKHPDTATALIELADALQSVAGRQTTKDQTETRPDQDAS